MTDLLIDCASRIRESLGAGGDVVDFSAHLPRAAAEKVAILLEEESRDGALVLGVRDEFRTTEAAALLGISRPTLSRLIAAGEIESRLVGTHHRIPASALLDYSHRERARRRGSFRDYAQALNDAGFYE